MRVDTAELRVLTLAVLREIREHGDDLERRHLARAADDIAEKLVDAAARRGLRSLFAECRELAEVSPFRSPATLDAQEPA